MRDSGIRACATLLLLMGFASAAQVRVSHRQGDVHAFLALKSDSGKLLGMADVVNVAAGKTWKSRLTIRFADGSVDDDTTVYTQTPVLRLLSDHHVQKGPSFPKPSDMTIDMGKGTVIYHDFSDGKDNLKTESIDLPADISNGLMPMVMQNYPRGAKEVKVAYMVSTPKPRLVKIIIHPDGMESYHVGSMIRSAARYRMHFDIGGIEGLIAPLVGKAPPDITAWMSTGEGATFLKLNAFLYLGGPMLRLELASPHW